MLTFLASRKRPTENPSDRLLFVHVPRCAGSNLWHSAARAISAKDPSLSILDLYHESVSRYQTIYRTRQVVEDLGLAGSERCLVHHHTSFGVWRLLGDRFNYFTILRDPVERALSHYFHSLRLYHEVDETTGECRLKTEFQNGNRHDVLGDHALDAFRQISQRHPLFSPEAILRFAVAENGMTRNYYVDFMTRYFEIKNEDKLAAPLSRAISSRFLRSLAEKMDEHFAHIFFSPAPAFDYLERSLAVKIPARDAMRNEAPRGRLRDAGQLKLLLAPYFRSDYELIDLLHEKFPSTAPASW